MHPVYLHFSPFRFYLSFHFYSLSIYPVLFIPFRSAFALYITPFLHLFTKQKQRETVQVYVCLVPVLVQPDAAEQDSFMTIHGEELMLDITTGEEYLLIR
jgi:hypothetical protein